MLAQRHGRRVATVSVSRFIWPGLARYRAWNHLSVGRPLSTFAVVDAVGAHAVQHVAVATLPIHQRLARIGIDGNCRQVTRNQFGQSIGRPAVLQDVLVKGELGDEQPDSCAASSVQSPVFS